ncbi:tRNA cytosine 38 C 5 methyltransferase 2, partial [Taenia solium]
LKSLSEAECLLYDADLWTMSPPCQPFTRMGNQKRGQDVRCSSLLVVIHLIRRTKPPAILLENVKGFEGSDAWRYILDALIECDYDVRQFLLTPLQFGIPNGRLRYYLVARLRTRSEQQMFSFGDSVDLNGCLREPTSAIMRTPPCGVDMVSPENHFLEYLPFCRPIADFLLTDLEIPESLFLGQNVLEKYYTVLDIVTPESRKSACFTKGYAHRFEGTGSFLEMSQVTLIACCTG